MIHAVRARLHAVPDEGILESLLTPNERARLRAVTQPLRRRELIVSRVLAKRLFVRMMDAAPAVAGMRGATFSEVKLETPQESEGSRLRDVEIGRAASGEAGPSIIDRGIPRRDMSVSIAHADGWTTVALSTASAIGVDVARTEARCASFYRAHFTKPEREWVEGTHRSRQDVLYTLLWTLKEGVVKSGTAPGVTLWGYDEIELVLDVTACDLGNRCESADGVVAQGLPLRISVAVSGSRGGRAWISRNEETLFSLVTMRRAAA